MFIAFVAFQKHPTDLKLKNGFYGMTVVGHAFSFYEVQDDNVFYYLSNHGTIYAKGKYSLNYVDSIIVINFRKTYHSKYPWKTVNPLKNDTIDFAIMDDVLVLENMNYEKSNDFYESQKYRIKKRSRRK